MEKDEFNFLLWKDSLNNELNNFWNEIIDT
jgi:hypothetical protein